MSEEEKNKIKEYQKKRYQKLIQYKKEALKNKQINLSVCNTKSKSIKRKDIKNWFNIKRKHWKINKLICLYVIQNQRVSKEKISKIDSI